jgi:hypothetical protein
MNNLNFGREGGRSKRRCPIDFFVKSIIRVPLVILWDLQIANRFMMRFLLAVLPPPFKLEFTMFLLSL